MTARGQRDFRRHDVQSKLDTVHAPGLTCPRRVLVQAPTLSRPAPAIVEITRRYRAASMPVPMAGRGERRAWADTRCGRGRGPGRRPPGAVPRPSRLACEPARSGRPAARITAPMKAASTSVKTIARHSKTSLTTAVWLTGASGPVHLTAPPPPPGGQASRPCWGHVGSSMGLPPGLRLPKAKLPRPDAVNCRSAPGARYGAPTQPD